MTDQNLRHNLVALGADLALFLIGLAFVSPSTVLAAFAASLGAPNVVIGAIPAVMTVGWFLPSLFVAGYTETLARKLPFVLRYTIWERLPFAILGLSAFLVAGSHPRVTLVLLLGMLLIVTGTGGLLMPAWMDIIGRTIPTRVRGRFFAITNRLVIIIGTGTAAAASVVALVANSVETFFSVFVLAGVTTAAFNVSMQAVLLEFAPTVEERPTYIGVGNTAMAPVMFGAPLIAGLIADGHGFAPVFYLAAAFGVAAVLVMTARVREPRHVALA